MRHCIHEYTLNFHHDLKTSARGRCMQVRHGRGGLVNLLLCCSATVLERRLPLDDVQHFRLQHLWSVVQLLRAPPVDIRLRDAVPGALKSRSPLLARRPTDDVCRSTRQTTAGACPDATHIARNVCRGCCTSQCSGQSDRDVHIPACRMEVS
jgi:hypothetical protein